MLKLKLVNLSKQAREEDQWFYHPSDQIGDREYKINNNDLYDLLNCKK